MGLEIPTLIALGGLAIGGVGAAVQFVGSKKMTAASRRAEAARKKIANLEHLRNRRDNIKAAMVARAEATSNASDQGAIASSSFAGALFANTSALGRATQFSQRGQQLGLDVFAANDAFSRGQETKFTGGGLLDAGKSLFDVSSSPFFT